MYSVSLSVLLSTLLSLQLARGEVSVGKVQTDDQHAGHSLDAVGSFTRRANAVLNNYPDASVAVDSSGEIISATHCSLALTPGG